MLFAIFGISLLFGTVLEKKIMFVKEYAVLFDWTPTFL